MDKEKYFHALEKAKSRYNEIKDTGCSEEKFLLEIFPELAENEDERIRKEIVEVFKSLGDCKIPSPINYGDIFTWLEKQGEQKPDWSEEDEKMLNDTIGAVWTPDYYTYEDKQEIENWLKSLKQRKGGGF